MVDMLIGILIPAVAVTLSPTPLVALLYILTRPESLRSAAAFLTGWAISLAIVMLLVIYVVNVRHLFAVYEEAGPFVYMTMFVIGVLLVGFALFSWIRLQHQHTSHISKWVQAGKTTSPLKSFGLGCFFAGLSPKNGLLAAISAVAIGGFSVNNREILTFLIIFLVVSSLLIAAPIIYFASAPKGAQKLSDIAQTFMQRHIDVVYLLLLLSGVGLMIYAYLHF